MNRLKTVVTMSLMFFVCASTVFAGNVNMNVKESAEGPAEGLQQAADGLGAMKGAADSMIRNWRNTINTNPQPKPPSTRPPNTSPFFNPSKPPTKKQDKKDRKSHVVHGRHHKNKIGKKRKKSRKQKIRHSVARTRREIRRNQIEQMSKKLNEDYSAFGSKTIGQLGKKNAGALLNLHLRVMKTAEAQAVLDTIEWGEGAGPLVIVGKGIGRGPGFIRQMNNLNFSCHPYLQFTKNNRCFLHNRQLNRHSTAAGSYQITWTNWKKYASYFGLKDFSVQSQKIVALELIRTGNAVTQKNNYTGRGYVELLKGNLHKALQYGTNDWASSPYSQWGGYKKTEKNYNRKAESIAKTIVNAKESNNG